MDFSKMTLREKILQTFVVTIREINRYGGPEKFFEKYPVGAMYGGCSNEEVEGDTETGTILTREKLQRCINASKTKLLVCADSCYIKGQKHEALVYKSLAASRSMEDAYKLGEIFAMQMKHCKIDSLFWPTADLYYDSNYPLYAMSDDAQLTADLVENIIRGMQDKGYSACSKHFPGLGTGSVNVHFCHGVNNLDMDEWRKTYGVIYKQAIDAGVMTIMTTHLALPSYAPDREDGYLPICTYSHKLTTELLKEELGFKGAVITDALIMGGMANGNLVEETAQAFKAGADLLLWAPVAAADRIEEMLLSGEIPMSRLEDALERIGRVKDFREESDAKGLCPDLTPELADKMYEEIVEHGICEYKNEVGLLPLNKDKIKKVLIIDAVDNNPTEDQNPSYMLKKALEKEGFICDVKKDIYDMASFVCWQEDIDEAQEGYDLSIINMNMGYTSASGECHLLLWGSQMFNKEKKLIINYGSPLFAEAAFPNEHTIVEVNQYLPTQSIVDMVVERLMGRKKFEGQRVLTGKVRMS